MVSLVIVAVLILVFGLGALWYRKRRSRIREIEEGRQPASARTSSPNVSNDSSIELGSEDTAVASSEWAKKPWWLISGGPTKPGKATYERTRIKEVEEP